MVRKYLQLTRAHTAPLETVPAALGAALAVGGLFNEAVLAWAVFGALYHFAGYGANSFLDWALGYDKDDPNKQDHPLNTGALSQMGAAAAVVAFNAAYLLLGIYLTMENFLAFSIVIASFLMALAYNTFGKRTKYKFIPISLAHTGVFIAPYIALGGDLFSSVFWTATAYMIVWIVFQIAISGELKDIGNPDEENLLADVGCYVNNQRTEYVMKKRPFIKINPLVRTFAVLLGVAKATAGFYIVIETASGPMASLVTVMGVFVAGLGVMVNTEVLTRSGSFDREHRVKVMSYVELWTLILFTFAFLPVVGVVGAFLIAAVSVIWLVVMNKVQWSTSIKPEV